MGPAQIIEVIFSRQIGFGISLLTNSSNRVSLFMVIPFFMISVEFMKKSNGTKWFEFRNMFNA